MRLRPQCGLSTHGAVSSKLRGDSECVLPSHLPVVREGWLSKRGGSHGGRTNWKKRWFVLLGDALYYMESRSDRSPRGRVVLTGCDFRNAEEELKRPYAFGIYNMHDMSTAPFFCSGESAQDTADWLAALAEAAQGRFKLPQSAEPEAALALGLIAQIVRDHEPRHLPQTEVSDTYGLQHTPLLIALSGVDPEPCVCLFAAHADTWARLFRDYGSWK